MNITTQQIEDAAKRLEKVVQKTPLQYSKRLSSKYGADIYLKREDLQEVRSFKIRGAYNKMSSLSDEEKKRGVVCASAGNHAQGVAYSCNALKIKGVIFMPIVTPNQKIEKVQHFGGEYTEIKLVGNTFDDASIAAQIYTKEHNSVYVHPFNDPLTIAGQGTTGKEIYEDMKDAVDIVVTDYGVAVNPARQDLLDALKKANCVPLKTIEELRDIAYSITGEPEPVQFGDRVVGIIEGRDGTIMDVVRQVKPFTFKEA